MSKKTITHFTSSALSIEERLAAGKALRQNTPIPSLGEYSPSLKRKDPISILEKQGETRLPDLVPIRYARMLSSSFAFLRGAAAIMAADLADSKTTGLRVQACGDMHIDNFGVFASAERKIVFGINDFDETLPGPWEWDLKRLVASIVVGYRYLGASDQLCTEVVLATTESYRKHMRTFAGMGNLELWYSSMTEKSILKTLPTSAQKALKEMTGKARKRTHLQVLSKLTDIIDDKHHLKVDPPFVVRETHTRDGRPIKEALGIFLESYIKSLADDRRTLLEQYRIVDVARKVVGVGSVGTRCWIIFLTGTKIGDPLFLQVKEAEASVLEPFAGKSKYTNHGRRVVAGQRLIQCTPDIFIGWGEIDGKQFYVRQLRDMDGGAEFDPESSNLDHYKAYGKLCGWALALSHAKSGDPAMISGYMGESNALDEAMVKFAFAYAKQNESDFKLLKEAAKSKRIKVAKEE